MPVAKSQMVVDPEILAGTPVFAGTRVPIHTLMDYLKAGDRVGDFIEDFPTVTHAQVAEVLNVADEAVDRYARSA